MNPINQINMKNINQKAIDLYDQLGNFELDNSKPEEKKIDLNQYKTTLNNASVLNELFKIDHNNSQINNNRREKDKEFFEEINGKNNLKNLPIKFSDEIFEEVK